MPESKQHALSRIRPPRVHITYDLEVGQAVEKKELPFVIGILSDLAGDNHSTLPPLKERKFTLIDRDNFNDIMKALSPRLVLSVQDCVTEGSAKKTPDADALQEEDGTDNSKIAIELLFQHIDDFGPLSIVNQVPPLKNLHATRTRLRDLVSKLDGNDAFEKEMRRIFFSPELLLQLQSEMNQRDTPRIDEIIQKSNILRDPEQQTYNRDLVKEFVRQLSQHSGYAPSDTYSFLMTALARVDEAISLQLDEILHHPSLQTLEGSWRGLHYLVFNTETGSRLKLRVLPIRRKEIINDLEKAIEFDQSCLFKKIYEEEYGTFGGNPFSCLLGDFSFGRSGQDVDILMGLSGIASAAHAPFLLSASPHLFDMDSFCDIGAPRDLAKAFDSTEMIRWNQFRATEDSRYVALFLPRVLMRQPYGTQTLTVEGLNYEEFVEGEKNDKFCWGNPAYVMAQRIGYAFSLYGWTAAIRGVEGGGLVENLPLYTFKTTRGDLNVKCPTEVAITDRREKELSDLGFISLCHCKGKNYAAFFSGQSTQKPKLYNLEEANANATISARLPYILNASRFAHYIKAIIRDKIGSFASRQEVALYLQNWLAQYILLSDFGNNTVKARYPLREGRVEVLDVPGNPGAYQAVIFLRPHFQLEELTVSLRLVAALPAPVGGA